MDNAIIIAQILGLLYLSVGVGMLLSPSHYDKLLSEFQTSASLIYLGGVMALLFGYIVLHMNNMWEMSYVGAITLIGWLGLVKGVLLLVKPDILLSQMGFWQKNRGLMQVLVIVLGAVFVYYGYFA